MTFITPSTSPKSTATATTTTPLHAAEERVEGHGRPYDGRPLRKGRGAFIVLEGIDRCGKTTQCALLLKHLLSLSIATTAMRFPNRTTAIGQMINSYLSGASGNSGGIAAAGGPELTDQGVHLLFSANRWECMPNLVKALGEGTNVICDRYAYSGVAFTSAKIERESSVGTNKPDSSARSSVLLTNVGGADGECDKGKPHSRNNQGNGDSDGQEDSLLSLSWCMGPDIGLPAPDAVIFLDVPQDVAERRGGYGGERYETRDMQLRVRKRFDDLQQLDNNGFRFLEGQLMPARKPTTASQSDSVITRHSSARTTPWHIVDASRGIDEVELDIRDIVLPIVNELVVSARKGSNGGNDEFNVGDIAGDGTLHVLPLRKMWQDGEIDLSSFAINTATVVSDSGTGSNNRS